MPLAVLIATVAVAGCSSAEGADSGDGTVGTPSIVIPRTPTAVLKPAKDCSQATEPLEPESQMDGVRLDASTDPTHTSLLLKNTGSLSVIVVPDASFASRLVMAPYANPTDQASKAALNAVTHSGPLGPDRGLPPYVPSTQVFIVPPQWAVCALTDDVREAAGVRYLRDKVSSAEYFVAKGLADQLVSKFESKKTGPTLIRCVKNTLQLLRAHPDLADVELYAEILGAESTCRAGYKELLGHDERATERTGTTVLNMLERTPRLLETTRLFEALARA
ncbi:hypothetical protein ACXC9Q_21870 [Kribbella sp. CWNU-51]